MKEQCVEEVEDASKDEEEDEMLGEDIAKLRDKLAQIDEAKKGVRAPKYAKKAKGSKGSGDDNNET